MRIFMTGATGFVGSALVLHLLREGHVLRAWVRSPERARTQLNNAVTLIDATGGGPAMCEALAECDIVVNLAGQPVVGRRWTAERRASIADSRVGTTSLIVDSLQQ